MVRRARALPVLRPAPGMPRWGAAVAFVAAAAGPSAGFMHAEDETTQCSSMSDKYSRHTVTINGPRPSTALVPLFDLGSAPEAELLCVSVAEAPVGGPCYTGVLRLCRNSTDFLQCQTLGAQQNRGRFSTLYGADEGPDISWHVAYGGQAQHPTCFPRTVTAEVLYRLVRADTSSSPTVSGLMWAFMVLIFVPICVCAYCWYRRRKEQKAQADRAVYDMGVLPEAGADVAAPRGVPLAPSPVPGPNPLGAAFDAAEKPSSVAAASGCWPPPAEHPSAPIWGPPPAVDPRFG
eukprot:TRINITY_DN56568_c0_g1_i1.p1 TRINITY_DN56568_c0_g1~~TRINITY_DN56568_c0_g1_i1.p1  ORF type:complete len:306 (+),score=70.00 TRINITY_DN56568_c0_g1_i1:47-919(+)